MLHKNDDHTDFGLSVQCQTRKGYVGQRVLRVEDPPLLRGRGQFIDDLPVKSGTLHVAILRSPHPHADIVSIDVSAALRQPGVRAVVTGQDVAALTDPLTTPAVLWRERLSRLFGANR